MEFNVADLWEMVVDTIPDHEALVCGDRRLTYAETDERANRLAHALLERGIGAGDHIGLFLYNGTEYLEAMIAAFKIRAVPVNVNFRYGEEELRYLLDDADTKAVIFHRSLEPKIAAVADQVPMLSTFIVVDDGPPTTEADPRRSRSMPTSTKPRSRVRRPNGTFPSARVTTCTSSTPAARPACPRA